MNKYLSRKFLMTLGVMVSDLGAALSGQVSPEQAISTVATAALAYVGVEGVIDTVATGKAVLAAQRLLDRIRERRTT